MPTLSSTAPLDLLREAVSRTPSLPALSAQRYARTHAAFEAASDQRPRLQAWLARELPALLAEAPDPVRVVGVGVGDGSVDFLVGADTAATAPDVREHLLAHLATLTDPERPGFVPHPLDVTVVRLP